MRKKLYQAINSVVEQFKNCREKGNTEWEDICDDNIAFIEKNFLPHGSGVDCGCKIEVDKCKWNERIVISFSFHFMDDNGMYDGWGDFTCVVKPCFDGVSIDIKGRDRRYIKEYLHQVFDYGLTREVEWDAEAKQYSWAKETANV